MSDLNAILAPGMLVAHPDHPDWGTGQVQSVIGGRITVNFPDSARWSLPPCQFQMLD